MDIFLILLYVLIVFAIWLNILATMAIKYDNMLTPFQKKAQFIIVWLIPIIGSSIVLRIVFDHMPDAIPKFLIPWPFKKIIYGKPIPPNKNRGKASHIHGIGSEGD